MQQTAHNLNSGSREGYSRNRQGDSPGFESYEMVLDRVSCSKKKTDGVEILRELFSQQRVIMKGV